MGRWQCVQCEKVITLRPCETFGETQQKNPNPLLIGLRIDYRVKFYKNFIIYRQSDKSKEETIRLRSTQCSVAGMC